MIKVTPYLKGKSVFFKLYIGRKPVWISTGIRLTSTTCWDSKNKRINARQYNQDIQNDNLTKQRIAVESAILKIADANEPLTQQALNAALNRKTQTKAITLLSPIEYFDKYTTKKKAFLAPGYIRQFKQVKNHITAFNKDLTWKDIDHTFYDEYLAYLVEQELQNNTISGHIKKITTIVGDAAKHGYPVNTAYLDFEDIYHEPPPLFLYWHEVELLEKCTPTNKGDLVYLHEYLLRCYNGLRWSDNNNNRVNHNEQSFQLTTIKNKKNQLLAMSNKAQAIMQLYNNKLPKLYEHDCNARIKEIAQQAGLNRMIEKIRFRGSERIVQLLPLHRLITTHTARRTFGRRWVDLGGNATMLMKFYSHSTLQQTYKYIGYEDKEMNEEMLRIFNQ